MFRKNTTEVTRDFFSDPSHGWLRVSEAELLELKIADKISTCSYQRKSKGDWQYPCVYLEEDRDAGIYIEAMKARGIEVKLRTKASNKRSRIRNYETYEGSFRYC